MSERILPGHVLTMRIPLRAPRVVVSSSALDVSWLDVATLVAWGVSFSVGILGLALGYPRPSKPLVEPPPVEAQLLHVELTPEPLPPSVSAPSIAPPPSLASDLPAVPSAPALAAVAEPSPAIAFSLPVEGPARAVELKEATPAAVSSGTNTHSNASTSTSTSTRAAEASSPVVQTLVFGQGEGKQPAPRYPARARTAGQEGTVIVRFWVSEQGRVTEALSAVGSPWPMLNDEAVRTVRESWRFRPGPVRVYDVAIRFELAR